MAGIPLVAAGKGCSAAPTADKLILRGEGTLWDVIPQELQKGLAAGLYTRDVTFYIHQALARFRRVIVPKGIYPIANTVLLRVSGQILEFEDDAWFQALSPRMNGIACPHGIVDAQLLNPGLIGAATDEVSAGHTAVLWNSGPDGAFPFGSLSSDPMGGLVDHGRFVGSADGTSGWNTFIHSNMAGGFVARKCHGRGLRGSSSGFGYGHVFSGNDVLSEDHDFRGAEGQGRHAVYGTFCRNSRIVRVVAQEFQSSGIALNTSVEGGNVQGKILECTLTRVALALDTSATSAAIELNYQGGARSGGSAIEIKRNRLCDIGANGMYLRGYSDVVVESNIIEGWGQATRPGKVPNYMGIALIHADRSVLDNNDLSSQIDNPGSAHIFVQESEGVRINGGTCENDGRHKQLGAVALNATGRGTPNTLINKVRPVLSGGGSWAAEGGFDSPTRNHSMIVRWDRSPR